MIWVFWISVTVLALVAISGGFWYLEDSGYIGQGPGYE